MQTKCLVFGGSFAEIEIKVRFLQIVARVAGETGRPIVRARRGSAKLPPR